MASVLVAGMLVLAGVLFCVTISMQEHVIVVDAVQAGGTGVPRLPPSGSPSILFGKGASCAREHTCCKCFGEAESYVGKHFQGMCWTSAREQHDARVQVRVQEEVKRPNESSVFVLVDSCCMCMQHECA